MARKSNFPMLFILFLAALLLPALGLGCSGSEATGKGEKNKRAPVEEDRTVSVRANSFFPAAFSPDNKLLIVALTSVGKRPANLPQQRAMQLWDVDSGKLLHTFWLEEPAQDVFFFDAGKKILASDYASVKIFDVGSRALDGKYIREGLPLAMMPDGKKLLVFTELAKGKALELWDPSTGKVLQRFPAEIHPTEAVTISPDGKWALIPYPRGRKKGIDDGSLLLWDLLKGQAKISFGDLGPPVAFTPDSKFFVAQHYDPKKDGEDKYSLRLWEISTAKWLRILTPSLGAYLFGFSPDGKEMVALGRLEVGKGTVVLEERLRRMQVETGKSLWSVSIPTDEIPVAVLSPDASRLFLGSGFTYSSLKDNEVDRLHLEIWDTVQGKKIRELTRRGR